MRHDHCHCYHHFIIIIVRAQSIIFTNYYIIGRHQDLRGDQGKETLCWLWHCCWSCCGLISNLLIWTNLLDNKTCIFLYQFIFHMKLSLLLRDLFRDNFPCLFISFHKISITSDIFTKNSPVALSIWQVHYEVHFSNDNIVFVSCVNTRKM